MRADMGAVDAWDKYDRATLRELTLVIPQNDISLGDTFSVRATQLGKAFKNYRRTVLHHLCELREEKRLAATLKTDIVWTDRVWTDEDMEGFLTNFCTFGSQLRSRKALLVAREDPSHRHHGKPLPRLIPPSLVKLWQSCLAQSHGNFFQKHFGEMSVHRLLATPLGSMAAQCGVDMELYDITEMQVPRALQSITARCHRQ
jgi:hypothetical protein